jgi:hypothetical protein
MDLQLQTVEMAVMDRLLVVLLKMDLPGGLELLLLLTLTLMPHHHLLAVD